MIFIGIDPGNHGGVAVLKENKQIIETFAMPILKSNSGKTSYEIDFYTLTLKLGKYKDQKPLVIIEELTGRGGWGATQTFKFGRNYQTCINAVEGWRMPAKYVKPQEWQKHFPKLRNDKNRSEKLTKQQLSKLRAWQAAKRIWVNPKTQNRYFKAHKEEKERHNAKKFHDGIVDALCIAYWGIKHLGETGKHPYEPMDMKNKPLFESEAEEFLARRAEL
jgi:hypothetical protein